jgi:hypothetical protein
MSERRWYFPLVALALVGLAVEVIAAGGLFLVEARAPATVLDLFVADLAPRAIADADRYVEESFDPDLGWTFKPGRTIEHVTSGMPWALTVARDGSRAGPGNRGREWVRTYGDSFTAGDEVDDDQTWQTYLAEAGGAAVRNFGVSGYGPYQALLRFVKHTEARETSPVTVFGVYEDGIRRVRSRHRAFVVPGSSPLGFKPALRRTKERVVVVPMPWDGRSDVTEALWRATRFDPYAEEMVRWEPPFTPQLWHLMDDARPSVRSRSMWRGDEAELVLWVLDEFRTRAKRYGTTPVVVWFPRGRSLADGGRPAYADHVGTTGMLEVDLAEVLDDPTLWHGDYTGHLSPEGNHVVAETLAEALPPARRRR